MYYAPVEQADNKFSLAELGRHCMVSVKIAWRRTAFANIFRVLLSSFTVGCNTGLPSTWVAYRRDIGFTSWSPFIFFTYYFERAALLMAVENEQALTAFYQIYPVNVALSSCACRTVETACTGRLYRQYTAHISEGITLKRFDQGAASVFHRILTEGISDPRFNTLSRRFIL